MLLEYISQLQQAHGVETNAVNPPDVASTEGEMGVVPQIQPTFDWVRLAQRVPVRIRLNDVPENIQLISGTTASISIEPSNH